MLMIFHALQTIGYYGFANWAPTFLLRRGVSLVHSLEYTMLIALVSPLGPALAVLTSDRLERKWTIVAMALLIAALGLGFAFWSRAGLDCCERRAGYVVQQLVFGVAARLPVGIVSDAAARDRRGIYVQLEPIERGIFVVADRRGAGARGSGCRFHVAGRRDVRRRSDHWHIWSANESDRLGTACALRPAPHSAQEAFRKRLEAPFPSVSSVTGRPGKGGVPYRTRIYQSYSALTGEAAARKISAPQLDFHCRSFQSAKYLEETMITKIVPGGLCFGLLLSCLCFSISGQEKEKKIEKAPMPATSAASGKEMFRSYCAACHGQEGKGDGPAASALKVAPANLTQLSKNNGGKFPDSHVVQVLRSGSTAAHGSTDMPVWGPLFLRTSNSQDAIVQMRISNLTKYIESLQEK